MLDILLVSAQLLALLGIALAIVWPRSRRPAAACLLALALAAAIAAVASPAERRLTVTATVPAYEELVIVPTAFVVDEVTAPGWIGGSLIAVFLAIWALWAWRSPGPDGPLLLPLALAWSSSALCLLLQKAAAPAVLVQPAGLDRGLWPATLAAGLLLAARCERLVWLLLYLSLFIALGRLPIAIAAVVCSNNHWGTSLDVSSITLFANPVVQQPVEVRSGSMEQQLWLIWLRHLVMMPGIYMMSIGGIAVAALLYLKHPTQRPSPTSC